MINRLPDWFGSSALRRSWLILGCALALALLPSTASDIQPQTRPPRAAVQAVGGAEAQSESTARGVTSFAARLQKHLVHLGVDRWHTVGQRGRGVKVAVLDSGFRGYRDHLGKALPSRITVRSFRLDGNLEARDSQHGILCGEVIHALAPDVELLFANWEPRRPDKFLEAVAWARQQGARIISCSLIMPSWSDGEGGGEVHRALARLLGTGAAQGDLLCFASAGNTAQRHWSGRFQAGDGGFHQWTVGRSDNLLTPWGDENVAVELCSPPGACYEMSVYEQDTAKQVARSSAGGYKDRSCAVVRFQPRTGQAYHVRIRLTGGKAGPFHCVALHSGLGWATSGGSVCFPADGPEVIAVGAVDKHGHRAAYSACGPNSRWPKPDLVAPVPFPSSWRARPFAGTSAAAPQAAALAALLWSRHPSWTAGQLRKSLEKSAHDLGPTGHDCETGYGLVNLPAEKG